MSTDNTESGEEKQDDWDIVFPFRATPPHIHRRIKSPPIGEPLPIENSHPRGIQKKPTDARRGTGPSKIDRGEPRIDREAMKPSKIVRWEKKIDRQAMKPSTLRRGDPFAAAAEREERSKQEFLARLALQRQALTVSHPNDPAEKEADEMADRVMRMPAGREGREGREGVGLDVARGYGVQRSIDGEREDEEASETLPIRIAEGVSRTPSVDEDLSVSRESAEQIARVTSSGGKPLENAGFFEERMGADFSGVRVHTGPEAAKAAEGVQAKAFTLGRDVVLGEGQYRPETSDGQRLIAHELTHTLQQGSATPKKGGVFAKLARSVGKLWRQVVQREPRTQRNAASEYRFFNSGVLTVGERPGATGPAKPMALIFFESVRDSLQFRIEKPGAPNRRVTYQQVFGSTTPQYETIQIRGVAYWSYSNESLGQFLVIQQQGPTGGAVTFGVRSAASGTLPGGESIQILAPSGIGLTNTLRAPEGAQTESTGAAGGEIANGRPVRPEFKVLRDPRLALHLLQSLEQFARRPLTAEDRQRARNGLDDTELLTYVLNTPMENYLTGIYTQGYTEFREARGRDYAHFFRLIERIQEQIVFGNPNAARNLLKIGYGEPERRILGIADRRTELLLYDNMGMPLAGLAGGPYRDDGFQGAASSRENGIELNVGEGATGIEIVLNRLRQEGESTRMVAEGVKFYTQNMELVNARVQQGLSRQVKDAFLEMLPIFVGFVGLQLTAAFLLRSSNPALVAIGAGLQAALRAIGYFFDIYFAADIYQEAQVVGYHLSRVTIDEDGKVADLSQQHLIAAAAPIRKIVTDLALWGTMIGAGRLVGLLRMARQGVQRFLLKREQRRLVLEEQQRLTLEQQKRRDELEKNPQTGIADDKSIAEAEAVIVAEGRGLVSEARRPRLEAGEPNIDFRDSVGWFDVKTARPPRFRSVQKQAEDIADSVRRLGPDVRILLDLRALSAQDRASFNIAFEAELLKLNQAAALRDRIMRLE